MRFEILTKQEVSMIREVFQTIQEKYDPKEEKNHIEKEMRYVAYQKNMLSD